VVDANDSAALVLLEVLPAIHIPSLTSQSKTTTCPFALKAFADGSTTSLSATLDDCGTSCQPLG